jgi:peptide-methionine (S)-S-oxide reductase
MKILSFMLLSVVIHLSACAQTPSSNELSKSEKMDLYQDKIKPNLEIATLGAGCFWCVEAVFQELTGVYKVESGYAGGESPNPSYKEVTSGRTGHAEVVQVHFDPSEISFEDILEVFWYTHDPTTLNRQGNDVGTQYRSVVFYHDEDQRLKTEYSKKEVAVQVWDNPIVTEISPFKGFYKAEGYHQNYFIENPNQGYCRAVIAPKVAKFRKRFEDKLKTSATPNK